MNTWAAVRFVAGAGALAIVLAGCGSAGSGGGNDPPLGGIDGGGFSKGTITGFGSIIVNGIEYQTNAAQFVIDGEPGTQADLAIGDVVSVEGDINGTAGTADVVIFDDAVEGPVQSVDIAAGVLVVMGQTVRVDGGTSFDDTPAGCALESLAPGDVVEVSGFRSATNEIRATRIECKAAGGELEVTGAIANLDTAQQTFAIGALTVDYSQAMLEDFPGGAPANGQIVEAKGTSFAGGVLAATRVEFKGAALPAQNGARVEFEGLVTRFASITDFDVSGQAVVTNGGTRFEDCGAAPIVLVLDQKVEVEGTLENGVITASEVECRIGTNLRVSSTVDSVDAANGRFVVFGIQVTINETTRLEDKSDADVSPFRLDDLAVGDFVEVRGGPGAAANSILAALVERDDLEAETELRASADNVLDPVFTLLGVTVRTDAGTEFEDEADQPISAAAFFAAAPGRLVQAKGTIVNGELIAEEVELEN